MIDKLQFNQFLNETKTMYIEHGYMNHSYAIEYVIQAVATGNFDFGMPKAIKSTESPSEAEAEGGTSCNA
jgi:hypothetical protein